MANLFDIRHKSETEGLAEAPAGELGDGFQSLLELSSISAWLDKLIVSAENGRDAMTDALHSVDLKPNAMVEAQLETLFDSDGDKLKSEINANKGDKLKGMLLDSLTDFFDVRELKQLEGGLKRTIKLETHDDGEVMQLTPALSKLFKIIMTSAFIKLYDAVHSLGQTGADKLVDQAKQGQPRILKMFAAAKEQRLSSAANSKLTQIAVLLDAQRSSDKIVEYQIKTAQADAPEKFARLKMN